MNSLVSIIIPTYKRSHYILRAINSVLKQTYKNIEIIVVDDNEGDDEFSRATKNLLNDLIDSKRIIYIKHGCNKGLAAARNTGINIATGKYIAFLDDDDEFYPMKTEAQLKIFNDSNNNIGLVYGKYLKVDDNLNKKTIILPKLKDNVYSILGLNHIGPPSMVMCTKLAIIKIGGFDELLRQREDIDLYYRLSEHYDISYTNEMTIKHHVHSGAMTKNYKDRLLYMLQYIKKHYPKIKEPKIRWSELQERLGELNAVNKNKKEAMSAFFLAYINRPLRLVILVKIFLLVFGKTKFRNAL